MSEANQAGAGAGADAGAGAGAATAAATDKAAKPKKTTVRILSDHGDYKCGQLAELANDDAAAGVAAGWADDDPKAVAYVKRLEDRARLLAETASEGA